MAAPFTFHIGRTEICCTFLWAEGVQGAELHTHSCAQYGDQAHFGRSVYLWVEMFKKARQD